MNDVVISLVVPCFNGGDEALATVLTAWKLRRPPSCELEAIIIDDASTDGSTTMLAWQLPQWARLLQAPACFARSVISRAFMQEVMRRLGSRSPQAVTPP